MMRLHMIYPLIVRVITVSTRAASDSGELRSMPDSMTDVYYNHIMSVGAPAIEAGA
jgi:hypothetical protein